MKTEETETESWNGKAETEKLKRKSWNWKAEAEIKMKH